MHLLDSIIKNNVATRTLLKGKNLYELGNVTTLCNKKVPIDYSFDFFVESETYNRKI